MSYRFANVSGTGGWLGFFIATLIIGAALGCISGALVLLRSADLAATQRSFALTLGFVAILRGILDGAMAARLQFSRARNTPRLVIAGLWISTVGLALVQAAGIRLALHLTGPAAVTAALVPAGRGAAYAAIWTAYLLRSRRVANTYGVDRDLIAAFE